jgi:hypothetical protein
VQVRTFYTQLSPLITEWRVDTVVRWDDITALDCSNSIGAQVGSPPTPPVSFPLRDDSQILVKYTLIRFSSRHTLAENSYENRSTLININVCYSISYRWQRLRALACRWGLILASPFPPFSIGVWVSRGTLDPVHLHHLPRKWSDHNTRWLILTRKENNRSGWLRGELK